MHSLALASPSLPPRLAYTQAAQLQVAQQLAAQQAAVQAAAGGPPTTRSVSALIRACLIMALFQVLHRLPPRQRSLRRMEEEEILLDL